MSKITFVGGVKGVGKTTLLELLRGDHPIIDYIHPGDMYWEQVGKHPLEEIQDMIIDRILQQHSRDKLIDTHYAAYYKDKGFQPCWSQKSLRRLAADHKIDVVNLCLIEASVDEIYERRMTDSQNKKRRLDRGGIAEELEMHHTYFMQFINFFAQERKLGHAHVVYNHNLQRTLDMLRKLLSN